MDVNSKSPQQALKRLLAYKRRQKNLERRLFNNREIASAERVMQELSGVATAPPTKIRTNDKLVALQTLAKIHSLFRDAAPIQQAGVIVQQGAAEDLPSCQLPRTRQHLAQDLNDVLGGKGLAEMRSVEGFEEGAGLITQRVAGEEGES
jgi:hypothetical protein